MTAGSAKPCTVTLRDEKDGQDSRHLCAWLDDLGNLYIDGQDLGRATAIVSDDGEYEWFETIEADDVSRLFVLLRAKVEDDILTVLEEKWSGARSYALEQLLDDNDIPIQRHVI